MQNVFIQADCGPALAPTITVPVAPYNYKKCKAPGPDDCPYSGLEETSTDTPDVVVELPIDALKGVGIKRDNDQKDSGDPFLAGGPTQDICNDNDPKLNCDAAFREKKDCTEIYHRHYTDLWEDELGLLTSVKKKMYIYIPEKTMKATCNATCTVSYVSKKPRVSCAGDGTITGNGLGFATAEIGRSDASTSSNVDGSIDFDKGAHRGCFCQNNPKDKNLSGKNCAFVAANCKNPSTCMIMGYSTWLMYSFPQKDIYTKRFKDVVNIPPKSSQQIPRFSYCIVFGGDSVGNALCSKTFIGGLASSFMTLGHGVAQQLAQNVIADARTKAIKDAMAQMPEYCRLTDITINVQSPKFTIS